MAPVAAVFVLLVIVLAVAIYHGASKLPAGPPGWPLLGNWRDIRGKPLYLALTEWSHTYGDLFSYKVGSSPILVVSGANAFEEIFNKKGALYNSRPQGSNQSLRVTGESRGVALPYGEPWRARRRVLQSLMSGNNLKSFLPYQDYESKTVLNNLLDRPETFYQEAARYASSVTFSMLIGARFESADALVPKRLREEMMLFWQYIHPGAWLTDWLPLLDYLPQPLAPWRKKADWMHNRWVGFWSLFFNRMNDRYKRGVAQDCFLARFLAEPDVGRWCHIDSVGIVAEILSAGSETTITSVQWFFRAAILFPDAVKKAQAEIDEVVGRDRLPQWEDRPNLPYVEALVQELHRWASVAPLAVSHATMGQDNYRGHAISKGVTVIPNTYAAHHNSNTYPQAERFDPARFLPASHFLYDQELAALDKHYAFGVGRRACPGIQVANASLYIVLSRVLWGFDIAAAPSGIPKLEILPSPLVIALAPFDCKVTPSSESARELIKREAGSLPLPSELECASVYDSLVEEWDRENPRTDRSYW